MIKKQWNICFLNQGFRCTSRKEVHNTRFTIGPQDQQIYFMLLDVRKNDGVWLSLQTDAVRLNPIALNVSTQFVENFLPFA